MTPVSSDEQPTEKQSSPSSSLLKERRFKLSRACDRCRRRRIKCDEGHPCQACLGANSPCTFEEPGKRSHPHKSKRTATLEDRMHHLESLIQAIPPAVFAASGASSFANSPIDGHNPLASLPAPSHPYPSSQPPPSLNLFSVTGPSAHFGHALGPAQAPAQGVGPPYGVQRSVRSDSFGADQLIEETARMSLSSSYLYLDDEGYTRWQGETSGLPIFDLLVERHQPGPKMERDNSPFESGSRNTYVTTGDWFPDRAPRRTDIPPERIWKLITSFISPDLMDSLLQCYLSTSYYLMPFLHVPTFLNDYGNPQKWGEPGFAAFVVAVCCLASRHIDDTRVRADPNDAMSSGTQWFELFGRLRALPGADRPTVYTIQGVLVAGVFAIGWGKLSKAFALISEAITLSIDAGLHRSSDAYDAFDPIEDEVRKRTFWCVYMWDKQAGAHFGRPPMIRLRDCDVAEPAAVDDEFITHEILGPQPLDTPCRIGAFVCVLRYFVVLESVLDVPPPKHFGETSPFLKSVTSILSGFRRHNELLEEEALCDEVRASVPVFWVHSPETIASEDVIRVTHSERIHCLDQFVRMLIARHRFSELVAERAAVGDQEQTEPEREDMTLAHSCALQIVTAHLQIASKGLMTYYGVHVIHQLTQAGRTLVAFLLNCQSESLKHLITPALDGLRSCVGLLKRFSGRYVCGQRSGDMMEEFCRITQIPLDSPSVPQDLLAKPRPPWVRPLRKKNPSAPRSSGSHESPPQDPEAFSPSEMFVDMMGIQNSHSGVSPSPGSHLPGAGGFDPTNGLAVGPSGFHHDAAGEGNGMEGMIKPDPMGMSHAEIMALFNGTGVDMSTMFSSPTMQPGFLDGGASGSESVGSSVMGTGGLSFGQPFGRRGNLTKGDSTGMVTSPS